MASRKPLRLGHPTLREPAAAYDASLISTPEFTELRATLVDTMREYNGVGIAGPQIGVPRRVIVIEVRENNPRYPEQGTFPLVTLVNPELTLLHSASVASAEGCLSIPGLRGIAMRHPRVSVSGLDDRGNAIKLDLDGFPAIISQHEVDHLDGHLYVDRLRGTFALAFQEEALEHGTLSQEYLNGVEGRFR